MGEATASGPARGPFVGRDDVLTVLASAVEEVVAGGDGTIALVAGEPGIGKTRLVTEVASRAPCEVLWSTCWEGDGAPAFWPWVQLLRALGGEAGRSRDGTPGPLAGPHDEPLPRLLGLPAGDAGADARFHLFDGVAEVLAAASSDRALMLVVDDLQWADPGSVKLLRFLARDPRARRLVVVATYRDGGGHDGVGWLDETVAEVARGGHHLRLDGLTGPEVEQLVRELGGGETPSGAEALHRRSGGNPFFVRELVRLAGRAPIATAPAGVKAVVGLRLAELSPATRATLTAAAVLGADFDLATLVGVTGSGIDDVLADLDESRASGLAASEVGSSSFRFVHAVVQEVLYDGLGLAERGALHAAAASALERRHGERAATEIAHHLLRATAGGPDERASAWATRAARHCDAGLAYEQAVAWYSQALALMAPGADPGAEAELLMGRAESALAAGDVPRSRDSYRQAAVVARERGDAELLARAALGLGSGTGGFEVPLLDHDQVAALEEALTTLGPEPSALRARVSARLSVALASLDDGRRRRSLSEDAIRLAREIDDPAALGYALAAHSDVISGPDHSEQRADEAAEIVSLALRAGDAPLELLGRRMRLVALLEMGDVAAAEEDRVRFGHVAEELRQPQHRWYPPLWQGMRMLMAGDPAGAAGFTAMAEEIGALAHSDNAVALTSTQRWVAQRYEGRFVEAGTELRDVLGLGSAGTPLVSGDALLRLRAVVAVQLGDLDQARNDLDALYDGGADRRARDAEWLPESAQLAEVAALTAHGGAAGVLYSALLPYAHRFCIEGIGAAFTGSVSWFLALLAATLGQHDDAAAHEAAARAAHRRVGLAGDPPPLAPRALARTVSPPPEPGGRASMVDEGATWSITFAGSTRSLRDSKGLGDLAVLLSRPRQEVHCLELAGGVDVGGDTGPPVDEQARRAYQRRIRDLQADVDEARAANDLGRAERAEAELDALVEQLAEAFGLSGRARRPGAAAERARSTVTSRIRSTLRQIRDVHPELGNHLDHSVRTGAWCSYSPERPVEWDVDRGDSWSTRPTT